jgi:chemotaxis protein MotA
MLVIESHIERPEESSVFQTFPRSSSEHHTLDFLFDYLRIITLGTDNPYELGAFFLIKKLESHHAEEAQIITAYQNTGDGFRALLIISAMLSFIKTTAAIAGPPEVLGKLIGGALLDTSLTIFLAYGIVSPLTVNMNNMLQANGLSAERANADRCASLF